MKTLKCSCCKIYKTENKFYKDKSKKRGYAYNCIQCKYIKYFGKNKEGKGYYCTKAKEFENNTKLCTCCNEIKEISEFKKLANSEKLNSNCRNCINDKRVSKEYNISVEFYHKLLKEHNNVCRICKKATDHRHNKLVIDHCHKTGKVRGLLCVKCNIGLGYFNDNTLILKEAINYLNQSII